MLVPANKGMGLGDTILFYVNKPPEVYNKKNLI